MADDASVLAKLSPVSVLNSQFEALGSGGNSAQSQISVGPFASDAVVLATASGSAAYRAGGGVNAGIILSLDVDGSAVARDDSFEGSSSNLAFQSSLSHNFYLPAKQSSAVLAKVDYYGAGGVKNQDTNVRLCVIALAAKKA